RDRVPLQLDGDAAVAPGAGPAVVRYRAHYSTPSGAKVRRRAAGCGRLKPFSSMTASREAELAPAAGPRQPTQGTRKSGHRASQPATVMGPQQGRPRSISRQLFSRIRHSVHTGYSG